MPSWMPARHDLTILLTLPRGDPAAHSCPEAGGKEKAGLEARLNSTFDNLSLGVVVGVNVAHRSAMNGTAATCAVLVFGSYPSRRGFIPSTSPIIGFCGAVGPAIVPEVAGRGRDDMAAVVILAREQLHRAISTPAPSIRCMVPWGVLTSHSLNRV
jgi:hypothetical protein